MKKDIHPENYRFVVFQDTGTGFSFLTKSTAETDETVKWEDGNEYPLVKIHVSSSSHPFYTGEKKVLDVEGRVDKFNARRKAAEAAAKSREASAKKAIDRAEKSEGNEPKTQKIGEKKASKKSNAPKQKKEAPAEQAA